MDALKNALSIVPSGTAATIIIGHALLTKVMICVETSDYPENYCRDVAIELPQLRGRRRVDGVDAPRHRADAVTGTTSRRWRGRPKFDFHTVDDDGDV